MVQGRSRRGAEVRRERPRDARHGLDGAVEEVRRNAHARRRKGQVVGRIRSAGPLRAGHARCDQPEGRPPLLVVGPLHRGHPRVVRQQVLPPHDGPRRKVPPRPHLLRQLLPSALAEERRGAASRRRLLQRRTRLAPGQGRGGRHLEEPHRQDAQVRHARRREKRDPRSALPPLADRHLHRRVALRPRGVRPRRIQERRGGAARPRRRRVQERQPPPLDSDPRGRLDRREGARGVPRDRRVDEGVRRVRARRDRRRPVRGRSAHGCDHKAQGRCLQRKVPPEADG